MKDYCKANFWELTSSERKQFKKVFSFYVTNANIKDQYLYNLNAFFGDFIGDFEEIYSINDAVDYVFGNSDIEESEAYCGEIINYSFTWDCTNEGEDYWYRCHDIFQEKLNSYMEIDISDIDDNLWND